MAFVAFMGCDGSGKSAVIRGVCARLEEAGRVVAVGHWAPRLTRGAGVGSAGADDPHGRQPRGWLGSVAKLGWLWLRWWVAWGRDLKRQSRVGHLLFDRYHGDLLVDPRRYRYGGPQVLARWCSGWMPQPKLVILLDADPAVLLARKQEVALESLVALRGRYLEFCQGSVRRVVVNAARPLDEVIDEVVAAVEKCEEGRV